MLDLLECLEYYEFGRQRCAEVESEIKICPSKMIQIIISRFSLNVLFVIKSLIKVNNVIIGKMKKCNSWIVFFFVFFVG